MLNIFVYTSLISLISYLFEAPAYNKVTNRLSHIKESDNFIVDMVLGDIDLEYRASYSLGALVICLIPIVNILYVTFIFIGILAFNKIAKELELFI